MVSSMYTVLHQAIQILYLQSIKHMITSDMGMASINLLQSCNPTHMVSFYTYIQFVGL